MKKKIIALVTILIGLSLLIVGCGENPRGSFGPSWDVPFTIPLIEEEEESIEDILDEQEDIQFEDDEIAYDDFDDVDLDEELDLSDELDQDFEEEVDLDEEFDIGDIDDLQGDFDFEIDEEFKIEEGFEEAMETSFEVSLDEPDLAGADFEESVSLFDDEGLDNILSDMSDELEVEEEYELESDEVDLDNFDLSEAIGGEELDNIADGPTGEIEDEINAAEIDPVPIAGQEIADGHDDADAELEDEEIDSFEFTEFSSLKFADGSFIFDFENADDSPTVEHLEIKIESDGDKISSDELNDLEASDSESLELDLAGEKISDELNLLLSLTTDESDDVGELEIDTNIEDDLEIESAELKGSERVEASENLEPEDFDLEWLEFKQGDLEIDFIIQDEDGNEVSEDELGLNPEDNFTLTFSDKDGEEEIAFEDSENDLSEDRLYFDDIEIKYSEDVDTYLAGAEIKVAVGFSDEAEVDKAKLTEEIEVEDTTTSNLEELPDEVDKVELLGTLELVIDTGDLDVEEDFEVKLDEEILEFEDQGENLHTHDLDETEISGGEELSIYFSAKTDTYVADEDIDFEFRFAEDDQLDIGKVTLDEEIAKEITEEIDLGLDDDQAEAIKAINFSDESEIVLDDGGLDLEDYGDNRMKLDLPGQDEESLLEGNQPLGRIEIDDQGKLTVELDYEIKTFNYDEETDEVKVSLEDLDWDSIEIEEYELDEEELDIDLLDNEDFDKIKFADGSELIIEITPNPTDAKLEVSNDGEEKEFTIDGSDEGKWEIPLDGSDDGLDGISSDFEIISYSGDYEKGEDIEVETELDGSIENVKFEDDDLLSQREEIDLSALPNEIKSVELTGGKLEFEVYDGDDDIVNVEELYLELPNGDRAIFETDDETEYTLKFSDPKIKDSDGEEEKEDVDNLVLEKSGDEWTEMAVVFEAELGEDAFDEGGEVSLDGGLKEDLDFGKIELEEDEFSHEAGFSLRDEIDEDIVNDLKSITFSEGELEIEIEDDGGLDFEIGLWINGEEIEKEDGKYVFSLEDEKIEFSDDEDDIEIEIALKSFTYADEDEREPIEISGGIRDVDWKQITISSDATDIFEDMDLEERLDISELREEFDEDLEEELNKIKGKDIELNLDIAGLDNLGLKAELEVTAYDESDDSVGEVTISEENESFIFTEDVINLMLDEDTDYLKLESSLDANGEDIVIEKDESGLKLSPSLRLRTPIDLSLSEDIVHEIEPESIGDEISSDDIERLEGVLESAKIEGQLDNQLPLGVKAEVYVGGIDENIDDETIKKRELYDSDNLISNLKSDGDDGIKANQDQKVEIAFDTEKADQFKEDNPYIGVKIILPEDDEISFTTNDYIKISDLKAVFVAQANQRD